MDSDDLNAVVDNLSDKLGVAAEALAPIAEGVVREVVLRNAVMGAGLLACSVVCLVAWRLIIRALHKNMEDSADLALSVTVVTLVALSSALSCLIAGLAYTADALSPTYTLLRSL